MSTATLATGPLTKDAARRLTARLRDALVVADNLLVDAYRGRAWQALGHASWAAYVEAELPHLELLSLKPSLRLDRVRAALDEGLSQGAVATMLGVGVGTVNRDRVKLLAMGWTPPATVQASDGRTMTASTGTQPKRRGPVKTDRTVALLLTAGAEGLTVLEVAAALKIKQHMASATLTRLTQARRVEYVAPERRGLFGRYRAVVAG